MAPSYPLFAPAQGVAPAAKPPASPRKKARRNIGALPKHLPRCEQVIEPDTTACPCCAGRMHRIGEEMSEVLDGFPAMLRVLRTIRPKYACRDCTEGDRPGEGAAATRRGRHGDDGAGRATWWYEVRLAV